MIIWFKFDLQLELFANKEILQQLQQSQYSDRARRFLDFFQVKVFESSLNYVLFLSRIFSNWLICLSFTHPFQLRCCGAHSFNDYQRYGMTIPTSCYLAGTTYINEQVMWWIDWSKRFFDSIIIIIIIHESA